MDETTPPDVTPEAASAAPAAAAVETVASPPVPTTPTTPATPSTPEASAGAVVPSTPAVPAVPTIEEIELQVGDAVQKLPADARFTAPDGTTYTLDELRRSPLLMRDYTRKTQAVAEQRRALEREQVEIRARAELLATNRKRLMDAYAQGGEALEKELRHQELLERDADYRQRFEESEELRVRREVEQYDTTSRQAEEAEAIARNARAYIARACAQHAGLLDPQEVASLYQHALSTGEADFTADSVDRIIARELQRAQRVTGPVQQELAALRAELAALKATATVTQGNAAVSAQIATAKAPKVGTPAAGAVPVRGAVKPFNPATDDPAEWKRQWRQSA